MAKLWAGFEWNQARAFLAAAEYGSFSAAARALNMRQPTLSRQVAGLETSLNVTLFERVGGGLMLTPTGERLVSHMRKMGDAAEEITRIASGQSQILEGRVSITAADICATHILVEALPGLHKRAPNLQIELIAQNELSDLGRREADIALRNVRPTQPELIAKLLGKARGALYGAPSLMARLGTLRKPSDLAQAPFLAGADVSETQNFLSNMGLEIPDENFPFLSDQGTAQLEMLKRGMGLGLTSSFLAEAAGLSPILPRQTVMDFPIWLIAHRDLATSARVRFVFDYIDEWIRQSGVLVSSKPPLS